ncbi:TadE/TadG family type IV pilus assembly protein [Mesorhizobium sp. ZC-5]|uniref:TadE/TadG family type IV pilus assembly protein n=1 Tax=Mesorhizobium sp. ZC-5 TaxID=2986066 RepID=UPI0021E88A5B|nr:pilus assembly protein TadG-related protein [Mesorhizobium sp. ZC-5]MCV3240679.1 pilus assembly protein TadG-related protein [Mesorhizobium sp. ZC-5]
MGLIIAKLRKFGSDENGLAMILVSIMLPVLIGFALLVIDGSRVNNLHNDLQKAADAFALAGAAELDGTVGSWARAERAMATLIDNRSNFSTTGPTTLTAGQPGGAANCNSAGNISWCFLKNLPASDATAVAAANRANGVDTAAGQRETRFIEVTVTPATFNSIFPASFLTGNAASNTMTVGARAVAGFRSGVCDYTPVFICNPYEDTSVTGGVTLEQAAQSREYRRRQILMRMNGFYMPGNFAFLEAPTGNGAQALEEMMASTKPLACYSQEGVDTEPGQMSGPVKNGLNARFGLEKTYRTSDPQATNVRMGLKSVNCNNGNATWETDPAQGVGLNRDSCHISGTCTMMGGRMGAGDWDFNDTTNGYWPVNHRPGGVPRTISSPPWGADKPTRYEVYRYELDPNGDGNTSDSIVGDAAPSGETGLPICEGSGLAVPDRRILYGAIIDCQAIEASGLKFTGKLTDVPVRAFGSFFITEPIKVDKDIFVELVDITGRGGRGTLDNFLRDEAQLYR